MNHYFDHSSQHQYLTSFHNRQLFHMIEMWFFFAKLSRLLWWWVLVERFGPPHPSIILDWLMRMIFSKKKKKSQLQTLKPEREKKTSIEQPKRKKNELNCLKMFSIFWVLFLNKLNAFSSKISNLDSIRSKIWLRACCFGEILFYVLI